MAYTIVSQVSLTSNDFAHRRCTFMVPVHGQKSSDHVSFLGKGKLSLKETNINNNTNTVRTRVTKSNVVRSEATPFRKPVTPITLEDPLRPPTNLYTAEAPHMATFRSVEPIGGDTYHIVFDHGGFVPHWEGQVFGVVQPGETPYNPVRGAKATLFSGASSRYGDFFDGKTASLCVRRMKEHPISDFLCTAKPGDKLQITGPSREATIIGDFNNPNGVHIMIATGTGVSTFRASLRRMFAEDIPKFKFSGRAWLLVGHRAAADQLYKAEFEEYKEEYPDNFQYNVALSREQANRKGEKMYVQDVVEIYAEQIFDLLLSGAFIYFAGLRGMVKPVEEALAAVAASRNLDWATLLDSYKRKNKWRVEVY